MSMNIKPLHFPDIGALPVIQFIVFLLGIVDQVCEFLIGALLMYYLGQGAHLLTTTR